MNFGVTLSLLMWVLGTLHAQATLPEVFGKWGAWKYGVSNEVQAYALMRSGSAPQELLDDLRQASRAEDEFMSERWAELAQPGHSNVHGVAHLEAIAILGIWDQLKGATWSRSYLAAAGDVEAYDRLESAMRSSSWRYVEDAFRRLGYIGDARAARLLGEFLFKPTPKGYNKYSTDVSQYPYEIMSVVALRRVVTNAPAFLMREDPQIVTPDDVSNWRAWWTTNGAAVIERLEREETARRGAVTPPAAPAVAAPASAMSVPAEVARPRVWPWVLGGAAVLAALGAWWRRRGG